MEGSERSRSSGEFEAEFLETTDSRSIPVSKTPCEAGVGVPDPLRSALTYRRAEPSISQQERIASSV
jgi:hypothetical protein